MSIKLLACLGVAAILSAACTDRDNDNGTTGDAAGEPSGASGPSGTGGGPADEPGAAPGTPTTPSTPAEAPPSDTPPPSGGA